MLAFAAARASRPAARAAAMPLTSVRHRGEHKKGKNEKDQAKAKVFDKLRRLVTMECRMGGADPEKNSKLAAAIARCRAAQMPKAGIDVTIKKFTDGKGGQCDYLLYEANACGATFLSSPDLRIAARLRLWGPGAAYNCWPGDCDR